MKVVIKRTNKKLLTIRPQTDGSVTVVAYRFLSQKRIAEHIAENINWISDCLQKLSRSQPAEAHLPTNGVQFDDHLDCGAIDSRVVKDIFCGKIILLCGQAYKCVPSSLSQTHLKDDCLYICEKQFESKQTRLKCITTFLKRMSSITLSQQVSKIGSEMALCPTKIQFKDLHGRWCSCTDAESRAIVLDYRLIQLPKELQNFVIAHAFAHFKVSGHGRDFAQLLAGYLPNQQEYATAVTQYSFLLDV